MGYYVIKIKPEYRHYFTFITFFGKFQYYRLAFRDSEVPDIFSHLMHKIFYDLPFVLKYLDDIIIISSSEKEYITHIEIVLQRLETQNLTVNAKKLTFFTQKINYLGFKIDTVECRLSEENIKAILALDSPKTC